MSDGQNAGVPAQGNSMAAAEAASKAVQSANATSGVNDRTRGHSPALDAREAAQQGNQPTTDRIKVGDGEFSADEIRSALEFQGAEKARKLTLPQNADGYELKLPEDFKSPAGVNFEWDSRDPLLAQSRDLAHRRGLDQSTYSDFLALYASNKIAEAQRTNTLIQKNREALGSAVDQRIGAIETWARAMAGDKAKPFVMALRAYPLVETVEMMEAVMARFIRQGSTPMNGGGRDTPAEQGKIPGYDTMSFAQRRVAQMSQRDGK